MEPLGLPPHLRGLFFDWLWDKTKVWALPTPAAQLPFSELRWHVALSVWTTKKGEPRFDLAPATVLTNPERHARDWERIQAADISYPLELFRNGE